MSKIQKEYNCLCANCGCTFIAGAFHAKYCTKCKNEEHTFTCLCGCNTIKVYKGIQKSIEERYVRGHKQRVSSERAKKSKIAKEKNYGKWMKGKKLSLETKEKISKSATGKDRSTEYKNNISLSKRGSKNGMYGKNHTEEAKIRIGECIKNNWENPEYRLNMQNYYNSEKGQADYRKKAFITQEKIKNNGFKDTKPEILMKSYLDYLQIKYEHIYPIQEILHIYYADFYIFDMNLIIEVDGKYWHNYPYGRDLDKLRTSELLNKGYNVLRYWEGEFTLDLVQQNLRDIKNSIFDFELFFNKFYLNFNYIKNHEQEALEMTGKPNYYKFLDKMEKDMKK